MKILKNEFVRYVMVFIIGCGLGAVFYPSKTIEIEERTKFEQSISKLQTEKRNLEINYEQDHIRQESKIKDLTIDSQSKIHSLKEENYRLKSKVTEKRFKIVKPDGTIEERWFKESETEVVASVVTSIKEEFTKKVKSIETKWMKLHEKRIKKIKEQFEKKLKSRTVTKTESHKKKKVEINARHFGISMGITTEKDYFSSISYDIFGPIFLNLLLETDNTLNDKKAGIGLGIKF